MAFIKNDDAARIRISVASNTETWTVGANGPVKVRSNNDVAAITTKEILLSPSSGITTSHAKTEGNISSDLQSISFVRGGMLLRQIGTNRVYERKHASEMESLRLAKRRINSRVDDQIDAEVAKINERFETWGEYLKKYQENLDITVPAIKTTHKELFLNANLSADGFLTAAPKASPVVSQKSDLYFQIHQSALNNSMATWANRGIEETKLVSQMQELFPVMMENLQKTCEKSDDAPTLTINFGAVPVDVAFDEDCIKVKLFAESMKEDDKEHPGMQMIFNYKIDAENGKIKLVADELQVFPLGFDPTDDKMSVREQTIRTIVMKRLEKLTEKPIVLENIKLKDGNASGPTLTPIHFSTKDGWLTMGYKLENEKNRQKSLGGRSDF